MNWKSADNRELLKTLLALGNEKEAGNFLRDLLTEAEIREFSKRWKTAKLLDNQIPYSQIEKKTGLSSATIARVAHWLNKGKGGYRLMLDRMYGRNGRKR